MASSVPEWTESAGIVVASGEAPHNAPSQGGYFSALLRGSHGLHHLDIYWQAESVGEVPDARLLLDRRLEETLAASPALASPPITESELDTSARNLAFIWLMCSVAAKYLARDPSSDMTLLSYPRPAFDECVQILGLENAIGDVSWIVPEGPLEKVDLLREIARKTEVVEGAMRGQGHPLSKDANTCLKRYFDLVEGILREAPQAQRDPVSPADSTM